MKFHLILLTAVLPIMVPAYAAPPNYPPARRADTTEVLHGTTATNGQLKVNWPNKVLRGDTAPGFAIDLAHKDLSLIVQAANAAKVPLPVAAAAREAFSAARAQGHGNLDFSAMLDVQCAWAGVAAPRLKSS